MNPFKRVADFVSYLRIYRRDVLALNAAKAAGTFDALWGFLGTSSLAGIMQVRRELEKFLAMLRGEAPRVILEIGTAHGGTLLFWAWASASDAQIITVDLPHGPFGGGHRRSQAWLYRRFAWGRQRIHFIRGDSHLQETVGKVKALLKGRQADFLFIDGDHSPEGVKRDYELYSPLVREGGIIAFHDIVPAPYEAVGGVPGFWAQLRPTVKGEEIVEDWKQGGFGIGWFKKPGTGAAMNEGRLTGPFPQPHNAVSERPVQAPTQPAVLPNADDIILSIIIVTYERMDLLERCLQAIRQSQISYPYEVIVVDNGSKRWDRGRALRAFPAARILENSENTFYAHANNQGMEIARGRYFLLLNSDAFLGVDSVNAMVEHMEKFPSTAVVGPRLISPDGQPQLGYRFPRVSDAFLNLITARAILPIFLRRKIPDRMKWDGEVAKEVDSVLGACWLIRAAAVRQVGNLCEDFTFYMEEHEWCYRARKAGYSVWYVPTKPVVHIGGASTGERLGQVEIRSRVLFWKKTSGTIYGSVYQALALLYLVRRMIGTVLNQNAKKERAAIRTAMLNEWKVLRRLIL